MKNLETQHKQMNRLQKSVGMVVLATLLTACGTGSDLAGGPSILSEAERVAQISEAMPMPDFEFMTEKKERVQLETGEMTKEFSTLVISKLRRPPNSKNFIVIPT
jgi:hypothetical protein